MCRLLVFAGRHANPSHSVQQKDNSGSQVVSDRFFDREDFICLLIAEGTPDMSYAEQCHYSAM